MRVATTLAVLVAGVPSNQFVLNSQMNFKNATGRRPWFCGAKTGLDKYLRQHGYSVTSKQQMTLRNVIEDGH